MDTSIERDVDTVARTLYGEARGEYKNYGEKSLIAVANVICNRKNINGESFTSICTKPRHFSCWNKFDPNLEIVKRVSTADEIFFKCVEIAQHAVEKNLQDITQGSTHYYSTFLGKIPYWATGIRPRFIIGHHIFLKTKI